MGRGLVLELGVLQGSGGFRSGKEKSRAVMCIVWYKGLRGLHRQRRGLHEAWQTREGLEEGTGRQEGKPGFCSA